MKQYYKLFIILLVVFFIIPQIAFASWWNPFSWNIWNIFFHKENTKTQILENKVKELEDKLNVVTTTKPVIEDVVKTTPKTTTASPAPTVTPTAPPKCSKYIDPATGKYFTPEEYGNYVATKIPVCDAQNKELDMSNPINCDGTVNCITYTQACQNKFGIHSMWDGKYCDCVSGYSFSLDGKQCIPYDQKCKDEYGVHSMWNGVVNSDGSHQCGCTEGYAFYGTGTPCQLKKVNDFENAPYRHDGVIYSPEQLNAMDCAWYGIGCPTINVRIIE